MQGFSANLGFLWADSPLIDRINLAHKTGFKAIEFHFPYAISPNEIKSLCEKSDSTLLGINTDIAFGPSGHFGLAANPERTDDFQDLFNEAKDWSFAAGAKFIHVMAGERKGSVEQADATIIANLQWAAQQISSRNLTLLIEPLNPQDNPAYALSNFEQARNIQTSVSTQNVKLMFDAYHAQMLGHDPTALFAEIGEHVGHIQLAGVPHRDEPIGTQFDLIRFLSAVKNSAYSGHIGLEYRPSKPIKDTLSELEAIWANLP